MTGVEADQRLRLVQSSQRVQPQPGAGLAAFLELRCENLGDDAVLLRPVDPLQLVVHLLPEQVWSLRQVVRLLTEHLPEGVEREALIDDYDRALAAFPAE